MLWRDCLLLFLGGGFGSVCRFLIGGWGKNWWPTLSFPIGTFIVNLLGCFLIGLFLTCVEKNSGLRPQLAILLSTGFCGGFTTFSSFAHENNSLLQQENQWIFIAYMGLSIILGLIFNQTGILLARKLPI